jgi:CubicO group peptidase (beta-lactamase class C family)
MEWRTPITPESRFYLGSLSKQFTAATILMLIQDGILETETPVRSLFPELPSYADSITVDDLIHHTSGLRDYLKVRQMAGLSDEMPFGNTDVLETVVRQRSLVFPSASRYQYSNSNYVLLAEIVSRVASKGLPELAQESVFEPAGLDDTMFESDPGRVMASRVESYKTPSGGPSRRFVKIFSAIGDGGAYSTPRDLARWAGILLRRDTFSSSFFAQFLKPDERVGTSTYAFGLHVRENRGVPVIEHGGSMLGFEHWMTLFPQQGIGFVLLTNDKTFDPIALRERLSLVLVGDAMDPSENQASAGQSPDPEQRQVQAQEFSPLPDQIFGRYHNEEIPVDLTLSRSDAGLTITPSTFRTVPARRTGTRQIEAMGGALVIEITDQDGHAVLHATLPDLGTFEFRWAPEPREDHTDRSRS